jgi:hypothetical protein
MPIIASDPIGKRDGDGVGDGDGSGILHPLLNAGDIFGVYRRPVQLL